MKSNLRTWLFLSFALIPCLLFSQNKSEISLGAGFPDFLNMKIKFGGVVQFYGGAGFLPNRSLSAFTTGLDWHFPIKSSENKTRKFYLNNGIAFFPSGSSFSAEDDKMVIWYSRTGFSIYNSTKTDMSGFDFDVGLFVETGYKGFSYGPHVITGTRQVIKDKRLIGPAASLSYFFKL